MPSIHIALRVARSASAEDDPIAAHQEIAETEGAVLFGKVGRPMGHRTLVAVNAQVETGAATYLFLAVPAAMRMKVYRGRVQTVTRELPEDGERLVPSYYRRAGLKVKMKSWFRLTELRADDVDTLRKLVNANTGKPLMSLLAASRSSMFIVEPKPGARI